MEIKSISCAVICMLVCACHSTNRSVDKGIIDHQREIDRLESELRARDSTIDSAVRELEDITARSSGMAGTVGEVIKLFDDYQRAVERLLYDYNNLRSTLETNDKGDIYDVVRPKYNDAR